MPRNQYPNRYGYGCCPPSDCQTETTYIPQRIPDCEPPLCHDGVTPSVCHCQFFQFQAMFPQFKCLGEEAICSALNQADCLAAGMLVACQKEMLILYLAAHIITISGVATTEASSRLASVASGSPLSRQTSPTGDIDEWLSLSVWGATASAMISLNPRLGVISVG